MSVRYRVQRVKPARVHDALVRVWRDNLSVDGLAEDKFRWIYEDAPMRPDGVFVLSATDAARGEDAEQPGEALDDVGHIVGAAGVGIRHFSVGGRELTAGLLADLAVDRQHRTALPAIRLVRQARQSVLRSFDLAYGYPNRSAEGVFLRCGYRKLGVMRRYALVLQHPDYLRRVIHWPMLSRMAGAALDAGRTALAAPGALRALRAFRLEMASDVDARFDALWAQAGPAYDVVGKRDAAFLRWRFSSQPGKRVRFACLTRRGSGRELRAYAVVEREARGVHVRDLFGHPGDLGALLDLLVPRLARENASSVSMRFLGAPAIVRLLESRGFRRRPPERTIVFDVGQSRAVSADALANIDRWHLTDADEDA